MKYIFSILLLIAAYFLCAQSNPRVQYQNELDILVEEIQDKTGAKFNKGPIFFLEQAYIAVFKNEGEYPKVNDPDRSMVHFDVGDTIMVIGAAPIGRLMQFTFKDSDVVLESKSFGRTGFEIIENEKFVAQLSKIKASNWKRAELLSRMLSCGSLDIAGRKNFEKHHINFGDTPVFFQVRLEQNKILLYFMLQSYGGNDYKNIGISEGGQSKIDLTFGDGSLNSFVCEGVGEDDRFAIIDITNYSTQFLSGIEKITFSLSKKEVSKRLFEESKFAIGLKIECMNR